MNNSQASHVRLFSSREKKTVRLTAKVTCFVHPALALTPGNLSFFQPRNSSYKKKTQPPSPSASQASHFQGTRSEPDATLSHRHDDRLMIPTCLTTAENSCKATDYMSSSRQLLTSSSYQLTRLSFAQLLTKPCLAVRNLIHKGPETPCAS